MNTWMALNSVGIALLAIIMVLVVRQLGYVLNRVTPMGARSTPEGPRLGEHIGSTAKLEGLTELREDKAILLVFVSEVCAVCGAVKRGAEELQRHWTDVAEIVLVYDGSKSQHTEYDRQDNGLLIKYDRNMRHALGISFVPFALIAGADFIVRGKGLVNEIGQLESLLEVKTAN